MQSQATLLDLLEIFSENVPIVLQENGVCDNSIEFRNFVINGTAYFERFSVVRCGREP